MNRAMRAVLLTAILLATVLAAGTAKARHGGPSVLASPGYQARLAESREAYTRAWNAYRARQQAQPTRRSGLAPRREDRYSPPR